MTQENKKFIFSGKYKSEEQKRINARFPVEIKGTFVYMDVNSKYNDMCFINSLSTGGLAFECSSVLNRGDVITVTFVVEGHVISEVCRVTRTHGKEVGCKFTGASPQNIKIIGSYIYKKLFS